MKHIKMCKKFEYRHSDALSYVYENITIEIGEKVCSFQIQIPPLRAGLRDSLYFSWKEEYFTGAINK